MKCCWLLLAALFCVVPSAWTYSSGPPASVCKSMTPDPSAHGTPQTTPVPYQLVPDKTSVKSGETVTLTLEKIDPATSDFKGFMVEAIDPANNSIVGSFVARYDSILARK